MMNLKDILKLALVVIATTLYFHALSFAGSSKASITVSATILARVSQSIIHQAPSVSVTEDDVKKGFVEIYSGTILQIKTNARSGYALLFEGVSELFSEVWVTDKGRTTVLSPNGGFIYQSSSGSNIEVKDLTYKFHLKKDIQPGSYSWPLRVRASMVPR